LVLVVEYGLEHMQRVKFHMLDNHRFVVAVADKQ